MYRSPFAQALPAHRRSGVALADHPFAACGHPVSGRGARMRVLPENLYRRLIQFRSHSESFTGTSHISDGNFYTADSRPYTDPGVAVICAPRRVGELFFHSCSACFELSVVASTTSL